MITNAEIWFPPHKCGLHLAHNENRNYYETVGEYLSGDTQSGPAWETADHAKRAIETNEIWELTWYPDTPVGSHRIAAPTFGELMAFVKREFGEQEEIVR